MDFFEAVKKRRSIRRFTEQAVPEEWITKALEAAILAPNSSNTQIWDFHWVKSSQAKEKVIHACLGQSAARTASHLLVVSTDPKHWRRSYAALNKWVEDAEAPRPVKQYYKKLIPIMYRWGIFNSFAVLKIIGTFFAALFRPLPRGPNTRSELQAMGMKSAALAAENFVLAMSAQGAATCMMEGLDEQRMKHILKLSCSSRVVMAIGVGFEAERGTWAPQFRIPITEVVHLH
jgi:nitroreductase